MADKKDVRILQADEAARKRIITDIYHAFSSQTDRICNPHGNHALYQAIEFLCSYKGISLISYGELTCSAGDDFTVEEISRLSHFPVREIRLEKNWIYQEGDDFLGWLKAEDEQIIPVVCVVAENGAYRYYRPGLEGTPRTMTKEMADRMLPQAYVFYRTFGTEALTKRDFIRFCQSAVKVRDVIAFFLLFGVCTMIGLLVPLLTNTIYDRFISAGEPFNLMQVCLVLLTANLAGIIMELVRNFAYQRISSRVTYAVQVAVLERILYLPASVLHTHSSSDLAKRVLDVQTIFEIIFQVVFSSAFAAIFSIAYVVLMFHQEITLASAGFLLTILLSAALLPLEIHLQKLSEGKLKKDADLASVSWQMVEGIEKIKDAGAEDRALLEYIGSYISSNNQYVRIQSGVLLAAVITMAYNFLCSLVFYSVTVHSLESISVGAFMAFMVSFSVFSNAVTRMLYAVSNSSVLKPASQRLKLVLETRPDYSRNGMMLRTLNGKVDMDGVTFAYETGQENILKNVSFHVKPGEYVGIAGSSGCGKSTFLRLLLGLEEPSQGEIYYDGHSLRSLDLQNLFSKMGIVLQNERLFSGTLWENITFTHPRATKQQVDQMIKAVGLEKDIAQMPMGLNTCIPEGGGTLSGGQQQRILLARAMVAEPSIILLDEATSALDNATQSIVCDTLSRMNATKIVIAHRLSTLSACDRILVMEEGRFVEEGSFQELMEKRGKFFELAERQIIG